MKFIWITLFIMAASGCSNKNWYEAIQHNHKLECQKLPDNQSEACLDRLSDSYDEYTRKRKEGVESN